MVFLQLYLEEQIRLSKLSHSEISKIKSEFSQRRHANRHKKHHGHHSHHGHHNHRHHKNNHHGHGHRHHGHHGHHRRHSHVQKQQHHGGKLRRVIHKHHTSKHKPQQGLLATVADLMLGHPTHSHHKKPLMKKNMKPILSQRLKTTNMYNKKNHLNNDHIIEFGNKRNKLNVTRAISSDTFMRHSDKPFRKGFRQSVKETAHDVKQKVSFAVEKVVNAKKPKRGKYANLDLDGEDENDQLINDNNDQQHEVKRNETIRGITDSDESQSPNPFEIGHGDEEDVLSEESGMESDIDEQLEATEGAQKEKVRKNATLHEELVVRTAEVL